MHEARRNTNTRTRTHAHGAALGALATTTATAAKHESPGLRGRAPPTTGSNRGAKTAPPTPWPTINTAQELLASRVPLRVAARRGVTWKKHTPAQNGDAGNRYVAECSEEETKECVPVVIEEDSRDTVTTIQY